MGAGREDYSHPIALRHGGIQGPCPVLPVWDMSRDERELGSRPGDAFVAGIGTPGAMRMESTDVWLACRYLLAYLLRGSISGPASRPTSRPQVWSFWAASGAHPPYRLAYLAYIQSAARLPVSGSVQYVVYYSSIPVDRVPRPSFLLPEGRCRSQKARRGGTRGRLVGLIAIHLPGQPLLYIVGTALR